MADIRQTDKHGDKEEPWDQDNPPGTAKECLLCEGEHASPRDDRDWQTDAEKAERRFCNNRCTHIHYDHKHNGGEKVRRKVVAEDMEKVTAHALCGNDIFTISNRSHFGADDFCDGAPACHTNDAGDGEDIRLPEDRL